MRNDGFLSLRTLSGYLRVVSSGASNVASSVRSAGASVASSIADRDDAGRDQVRWAGFDKLECEGGLLRRVLLLGYRSGFEVWDVEEGDDVRQLVARHDGAVSFIQVQKKPVASRTGEDHFTDVRPLLVIAVDQSFSVGGKNIDGAGSLCNGSVGNFQELGNDTSLPTSVSFYSLRTHDYVHVLRFRSPVYSIRCSSRVVAVSQASQIHCFNAATLAKEYTVVTSPIVRASLGSGGIGCGPLALGSRWLAYNGTPVEVSSTDRVKPQHLAPATDLSSYPTNGSLVAQYAKESSKQLAVGMVTLGDMGYKKLSKYCSELIPDQNSYVKHGNSSLKNNSATTGNISDRENSGMVIVRDIISKSVVVQFRAHESPISALAFDPSGTLLVTASVHGHNINVFSIMPSLSRSSSGTDATGICVHLYRLQRGITNAVIQDISFSDDSQLIIISSSRGTSHLFSISPYGGSGDIKFGDVNVTDGSNGSDMIASLALQWSHKSDPSKVNNQSFSPPGLPVTLSAVSRIKNGSIDWKGAVSGAAAAAAAAATGRVSPLYGAVASTFHRCKGSSLYSDTSSLWTKYYLLVFSPSGCIIQYVLRHPTGEDSGIDPSGLGTLFNGSLHGSDSRLVVEALQKWDVCHKRNRRYPGDNIDVYGEHSSGESAKVLQKGTKKGTSVYPADSGVGIKVKATVEENNHMHISEVELHMHSDQVPLWAKPKIHFQVMVDKNIYTSSTLGGEVEIERIPTHTIEARTRELIPVFDYFQTPRFEQSRENSIESNINGPLMRQNSGMLEDERRLCGSSSSSFNCERHLCGSSCSSLDCMPPSAAVAELPHGFAENDRDDLQPSAEVNKGFVRNSPHSPDIKNQLEFVNYREGLKMEAQFEHVNNNKEAMKMENHMDYDNVAD